MRTYQNRDNSPAADVERTVREVASALDAGELAILPTETVYGVFGSALHPSTMDRLQGLVAPQFRENIHRHTWHAGSVDEVLETVPVPHPRHRRMMRRLLPGPVRIDLELDAHARRTISDKLSIPVGTLDPENVLAIRVPSPSITRRVLDAVRGPLVANRLAALGWTPDRTVDAALEESAGPEAGIAAVIDEGKTRFGQPSTVLHLTRSGGYRVRSPGVLEARMIDKLAHTTILFVCTGNTCRSPMAAAIARSRIRASSGDQDPPDITVVSAGTSASSGRPASVENAEALRSIGVAPGEHSSRPLTRQTVAGANAIFVMSAWHREEVLALDPAAGSRTWMLDPSGRDVPDPVGLAQEVYNQTAVKLDEFINRRLTELDLLDPARNEDSP